MIVLRIWNLNFFDPYCTVTLGSINYDEDLGLTLHSNASLHGDSKRYYLNFKSASESQGYQIRSNNLQA